MLIVITTGSRDLDDPHRVSDVMDALLAEHRMLAVRVGDCPDGADRYVRQWCTEKKALGESVEYEVFEANWRGYGQAAGPIRNARMVAAQPRADLCVAWYEPDALNKGTSGCVRLAKKAGLPVDEYGDEATLAAAQRGLW